jgi:hypothetical protein
VRRRLKTVGVDPRIDPPETHLGAKRRADVGIGPYELLSIMIIA